jgi:hypothetical protein
MPGQQNPIIDGRALRELLMKIRDGRRTTESGGDLFPILRLDLSIDR